MEALGLSPCHQISEGRLVMSDSLPPHGLYSPWNSPGQNTGVGSLFLLQGDLPDPGIKLRSPALQAGSLPSEPQRKWKWSRSVMSDSLWPRGLYSPPGSTVHGSYTSNLLKKITDREKNKISSLPSLGTPR